MSYLTKATRGMSSPGDTIALPQEISPSAKLFMIMSTLLFLLAKTLDM